MYCEYVHLNRKTDFWCLKGRLSYMTLLINGSVFYCTVVLSTHSTAKKLLKNYVTVASFNFNYKTIEFNVKCGRTFVPYVLQRKKGLTRENLARHKSRQMCSINSVQMIKTENPQTKKCQKMCGTLSFFMLPNISNIIKII